MLYEVEVNKPPGNMSGRQRQCVKGRSMDPQILQQVDRTMVARAGDSEGDEYLLWRLNCLMHAGNDHKYNPLVRGWDLGQTGTA